MSYTLAGGPTQMFRGLHLRTHPDADKAPYQTMFSALEIVLSDGTRVADWNDVVTDVTVSGAGGLDTGAEGASRWYEQWAITNGVLKKGLFHLAKNYTLDQSQTTRDGGGSLRYNTSQEYVGQTFLAGLSGPLESIDIPFNKVSTPTGRFWVSIFATAAGVPTGSPLYTSDKLDVSLVSATAQWIRMVFRDPPTLAAGTTYAFAVTGDYAYSTTVYLGVGNNSAGGYGSGSRYDRTSAGAWNIVTGQDLAFKIYVTQNDAAPTMPSGYVGAKIGYVYNDSGSNFDGFVAKDRYVANGNSNAAASSSAQISTLVDVSAFIPPGVLKVQFGIAGATAGDQIVFGAVPGGYAGSSSPGEHYQASNAAYNGRQTAGFLPTEYQGCYIRNNTAARLFELEIMGYEW